MQIDTTGIIVGWLGSVLISAVVGSGVTVIGFREKLSLLTKDVEYIKQQMQNDKTSAANSLLDVRRDFQSLCQQLSDRANDSRTADRDLFNRLYQQTQEKMQESERRQKFIMDLLVSVAQKHGIHHRLTDILLNASTEEERER